MTEYIQATAIEGFALGPYLAARGGVELATFRTEGPKHHHSATTPHWMNECFNYAACIIYYPPQVLCQFHRHYIKQDIN